MLLRMDLSAQALGFDGKDFGEDFVVVSALRDSHTLRYCDCTVHNVLVFEDDIQFDDDNLMMDWLYLNGVDESHMANFDKLTMALNTVIQIGDDNHY